MGVAFYQINNPLGIHNEKLPVSAAVVAVREMVLNRM